MDLNPDVSESRGPSFTPALLSHPQICSSPLMTIQRVSYGDQLLLVHGGGHRSARLTYNTESDQWTVLLQPTELHRSLGKEEVNTSQQ